MECILTGQVKESVYKTAQENGYTGSEVEFYEDLVSLKDGPFLPLKGGQLERESIITWGEDALIGFAKDYEGFLIGSGTTTNINFMNSFLTNVATPSDANDAANKKYVDSKVPKATEVMLTASGWDASAKTQKVTVSSVLADETKQLIMPMPAMASQNAYAAAGIACTLQEANALTFRCQTADISVFVTIQEVMG